MTLKEIHADIAIQYSEVALHLRDVQARERELATALAFTAQQLRETAVEEAKPAVAASPPLDDAPKPYVPPVPDAP